MEFIQQNMFMIAVALISGTMLLVLSVRRPGGHNPVTPNQAIQLINREDAFVIDVREQAEYVAGHVADARHIPLADLEARAADLDKYKAGPVIVVCQTGVRSNGACKTLDKLGFAKVHSLQGGIAAWAEAGLPLKKGARK